MEPVSRKIANICSGIAGLASVVVHPIPAADDIVVVPVHYALCLQTARARGVSIFKLPWRNIQRIIWYGAGARFVVNFSLAIVPFVGAVSNCVTAIALTEYLARYLDQTISHPDQPPPEVTLESLKTLFKDAIRKHEAESK
jgi:uncharacterized protein (DUF697 family)